MQIDRAPRKARPIPLTPLIDVVFLLVVFFMVTTSFIKIESIELNLPSAAQHKKNKMSSSNDKQQTMLDSLLVVDVEKTGRVFVNQEAVERQALEMTLRRTMKDKRQKFLVRVGTLVSVQQLVEVMDEIHMAGGRDVSVTQWDGRVALSEQARERISKQILEPVIVSQPPQGDAQ